MLIQSSLLLLAVVQVLIPGSQTSPTAAPVEAAPEEEAAPVEAAAAVPIKDCTAPWFQVDDQCFQVVSLKALKESWTSARVFCNVQAPGDAHGDLAVLTTTSIQNRMYQVMKSSVHFPKGKYWIGASDLYIGEEWYWINGVKLNTDPPHTQRADDCLYLNIQDNELTELTDNNQSILGSEGCATPQFFVCEKQ